MGLAFAGLAAELYSGFGFVPRHLSPQDLEIIGDVEPPKEPGLTAARRILAKHDPAFQLARTAILDAIASGKVSVEAAVVLAQAGERPIPSAEVT